jgi:phosphatidylglycerol---prolipoprotein diacylglyceryl transferase
MSYFMPLTHPFLDPVLFQIGSFALRWYALAYIAGLLGGWMVCRSLIQRTHLWGASIRPSLLQLDDLLLWIALGVVGGGRLGYVLFYNLDFYLANPTHIFMVWRGGMSFHGGLLGAFTAMILFGRKYGLSSKERLPWGVIDLVAVVAPIGLFFGRIANFINGELWGRTAPNFAYAVIFPEAGMIPRHASQLYEAGTEGLLLGLIMVLTLRIFGFRREGLLTGIFAAGYAVARIACEFFREPDPQLGFLLGTDNLTMGMILSMPMLLTGLFLIWRAFKNPVAAVG